MSYEIVKAIAEGRGDLALVTVVEVQGSAPRHAGSKMLVRAGAASHPFLGTVGGGKGEARAIAEALEAIQQKKPRQVTLEFHGVEIEGQDMICGGTSRLLIEPTSYRTPYRIASERIGRGERVLLVETLAAEASIVVAVLDEQGAPRTDHCPRRCRPPPSAPWTPAPVVPRGRRRIPGSAGPRREAPRARRGVRRPGRGVARRPAGFQGRGGR